MYPSELKSKFKAAFTQQSANQIVIFIGYQK